MGEWAYRQISDAKDGLGEVGGVMPGVLLFKTNGSSGLHVVQRTPKAGRGTATSMHAFTRSGGF